ncbi:hypothetical protein COF68_06010 [Bacillus toyonensis]|uniref:hypothetical protein n=1 Tax=Bacillus toyonensis TaxID=155322 RepID=UPI000BFD35B6|nr:hypothetical protein [Bacillus toyonensis]PHE64390.1 hypothetical protein COF68_06010 [Bacillus toyonensis]
MSITVNRRLEENGVIVVELNSSNVYIPDMLTEAIEFANSENAKRWKADVFRINVNDIDIDFKGTETRLELHNKYKEVYEEEYGSEKLKFRKDYNKTAKPSSF